MKKIMVIVISVLVIVLMIGYCVIGNKKDESKNIANNEKKDIESIESIDDFYSIKLTKNKDIRNLDKDYSVSNAIEDNYLVVSIAKVYNDNLYLEFKENYENKKSSFIRVVQTTIEGDLILTDILYYEKSNKIYVITDNTRDEYSSIEDRVIKLRDYENSSEFNYNGGLYWVLYDGEISSDKMENGDIFIVTAIN